jgi:hypothetical protein
LVYDVEILFLHLHGQRPFLLHCCLFSMLACIFIIGVSFQTADSDLIILIWHLKFDIFQKFPSQANDADIIQYLE